MGEGFIKSFKRGLAGDDTCHYRIADAQITCAHCGGTEFEEREAMLNTPVMTFIDLDWANRSATALVCVTCTHIEWFLDVPERV